MRFFNFVSLSLCKQLIEMNKSENKEVGSNKAYRLILEYSDTVDMAKKVLMMYNGYLTAMNGKSMIDARHINLLSYYFAFGYSQETKQKFAHCYSTDMQYVSVLDTEMKKRGVLIDRDGNFRSRSLSPDIENMRRLFVVEGSRDKNALVGLFVRNNELYRKERE